MAQNLRIAATILVVAVVATGCERLFSPKEMALFDDAKLVVPLLPRSPDGSVQFSMGTYKGGTAVLGEHDTAFWVKDGVPYTVTEAARSAAPDMAKAPESIQYNDEFIAAAEAES